MKRREFLHMTAAGSLALGLPVAGWSLAAPDPMDELARPGLLELFGDSRRVREIGVAYCRAFPEETAPEVLSRAILSDIGPRAPLPEGWLRDRLDQRIQTDFARGSVVELRGWILSRTEARQCALYSIIHG